MEIYESRAISIAVLMLLCALLAAGCGGQKQAGASTTAASTTTRGSARSRAQCLHFAEAAADAQTQLAQGLAGDIFKGDPLADAVSFRGADISRDARKFAGVAARVPAAVKGPFATVSLAFARMGAALKPINLKVGGSPDAAALAALRTFTGQIDRPALSQAETDITTWLATSCRYY